jgi:SNF2 family DNA or RNA helicase
MWKEEIRDLIRNALQNQLTEKSSSTHQPTYIKTPLRPHQLTLLEAARRLEKLANFRQFQLDVPQLMTSYGVLADRVGAGKSLVALSLIRDPPPENTTINIRNGSREHNSMLISLNSMPPVQPFLEEWRNLPASELFAKWMIPGSKMLFVQPSLIIVPHNVCAQWENYIKEQTTLNAYIVKRTKDCDFERPDFFSDVFMSDVVLLSSTMVRKFVGALGWRGPGFGKIVWSRLFVDEADSIQCSLRYGEIQSRFAWFISGSWLNMLFTGGLHFHTLASLSPEIAQSIGSSGIQGIQSTHGFIAHTLTESRNPAFAQLLLRNSDAWIDTSLTRPSILHSTILCKTPQNLNILRGFISPAAMEALHAGDTAGAMSALGLKTASKETLVERVTSGLKGELLQAEKILEFKRSMEYSTPAAKLVAIEKAEQKVSRIREQLASLESRISHVSQELCPICYECPESKTLTPCCRQVFCLSCLCECIASNPTCPMCRNGITSVSNLLVIGDGDDAVEEKEDPLPTKGASLLKLLEDESGDETKRYLIFSAHEASFKGLREILSSKGIRCEMLYGSGARIERLRRQFQDGTVRVLCMNARHVGAGINLESATTIILYHRMNTELEAQVIGRAIRFERTKDLQVVHLVHEQETSMNGASSSEVIVHM